MNELLLCKQTQLFHPLLPPLFGSALEFNLPGDDGSVDVFRQPDVRLLLRLQEVDGVRDVRRVESLLHQPHLLHLEGSRHLQAGLQNTQSELRKNNNA